MIKVAVTNLGKYNEGELVYKWINLPTTTNEINKTLKEIGVDGKNYEEYFISDYIFNGKIKFNITEYSSISRLNEIAKELESLDEMQLYAVQAYIELYGDDIDSVYDGIEIAKNGDYNILYDCKSMEDVAYHIINESGIYELPEIAKTYFDYEAFGRDLEVEGNFIFVDGGVCVELLN